MHLGIAECHVPFWVTVTLTLTSDLVFRIIMSGAYLLYYRGRNLKFGVWMHLGMTKCRIPLLGHCDLELDL